MLPLVRLSPGEVYNGDLVEKTVDALTKEVGKHGYPFTHVHPRGDRDPATHTVTIAFVLDEGPRVPIVRIVVRGNTRTRDYVIRREFEIGEGDAYNKVLIDRAERRLNNLGYFKKVKITNEQGSTSDRVIVVVDVEDQPTGSLSLSGGYSTTQGFIAEVSVTETNFMGRGQFVRLAVSEETSSARASNSISPNLIFSATGSRRASMFTRRRATPSNFLSTITSRPVGRCVRHARDRRGDYLLAAILDLRHGHLHSQQFLATLQRLYQPDFWNYTGFWHWLPPSFFNNCLTNGEASGRLGSAGPGSLTSMFGYGLAITRSTTTKIRPTAFSSSFRQDIAGAGGDEHLRAHHRRSPLLSRDIRSDCRARASARRRSGGFLAGTNCASSTISTSGHLWCAGLLLSASKSRDIGDRRPPGRGDPLGGTPNITAAASKYPVPAL